MILFARAKCFQTATVAMSHELGTLGRNSLLLHLFCQLDQEPHQFDPVSFRFRVNWRERASKVHTVSHGSHTPPHLPATQSVGEISGLSMRQIDKVADHGRLRDEVMLEEDVSDRLQSWYEALGLDGLPSGDQDNEAIRSQLTRDPLSLHGERLSKANAC
jgi:hypothetical protein